MTITIRKATHEDVETLARLSQAVQQIHVDARPERYKPVKSDNAEVMNFYTGFLSDPNAHIFIAEDENKQAVGHLLGQLRVKPENAFVYGQRDFHIDQMAVEPAYQRQGVGHLLIEKAIATAKQLNVDVISLGVAAFNTSAIRFYEQHGFKIRHMQMDRSL